MDASIGLSDWRELDPDLSFVAGSLADLYGFWRGLRGGRRFPSRDDFLPEDLRGHLGWVILLDVERAPMRFRFRLVGSGITAALSRDSTGRYLDELYPPAILDKAVRPYAFVVEHRRPVRSVGRMVHADKGHIAYEAAYLPYSDDGDRVDLIMERVLYDGFD